MALDLSNSKLRVNVCERFLLNALKRVTEEMEKQDVELTTAEVDSALIRLLKYNTQQTLKEERSDGNS